MFKVTQTSSQNLFQPLSAQGQSHVKAKQAIPKAPTLPDAPVSKAKKVTQKKLSGHVRTSQKIDRLNEGLVKLGGTKVESNAGGFASRLGKAIKGFFCCKVGKLGMSIGQGFAHLGLGVGNLLAGVGSLVTSSVYSIGKGLKISGIAAGLGILKLGRLMTPGQTPKLDSMINGVSDSLKNNCEEFIENNNKIFEAPQTYLVDKHKGVKNYMSTKKLGLEQKHGMKEHNAVGTSQLVKSDTAVMVVDIANAGTKGVVKGLDFIGQGSEALSTVGDVATGVGFGAAVVGIGVDSVNIHTMRQRIAILEKYEKDPHGTVMAGLQEQQSEVQKSVDTLQSKIDATTDPGAKQKLQAQKNVLQEKLDGLNGAIETMKVASPDSSEDLVEATTQMQKNQKQNAKYKGWNLAKKVGVAIATAVTFAAVGACFVAFAASPVGWIAAGVGLAAVIGGGTYMAFKQQARVDDVNVENQVLNQANDLKNGFEEQLGQLNELNQKSNQVELLDKVNKMGRLEPDQVLVLQTLKGEIADLKNSLAEKGIKIEKRGDLRKAITEVRGKIEDATQLIRENNSYLNETSVVSASDTMVKGLNSSDPAKVTQTKYVLKTVIGMDTADVQKLTANPPDPGALQTLQQKLGMFYT